MIKFGVFARARRHFSGSQFKSTGPNDQSYTPVSTDFLSSRMKMFDQHIEQFQFRGDDSTQSQSFAIGCTGISILHFWGNLIFNRR